MTIISNAPFADIPADAIPFNIRDAAGINLTGQSAPGVQVHSPGTASCTTVLPLGGTVRFWIVRAMLMFVMRRTDGSDLVYMQDYLTNVDMSLTLYDISKPPGTAGWDTGIIPGFGLPDSPEPCGNGNFAHTSFSRYISLPTVWDYSNCPQALRVIVPSSGGPYFIGSRMTVHTGAEEGVHYTYMIKGAWKQVA